MNRRLFFKAMAGIAALLTSAWSLVAKRKPETETFIVSRADDLPIALGVGDKLSVSFASAPSRVEPFLLFVTVEREYTVTDIRVLAENGAPVHWKRTSADW